MKNLFMKTICIRFLQEYSCNDRYQDSHWFCQSLGATSVGEEIIVEAFPDTSLGHSIATHVVQTFCVRAMRRRKRTISIPFANAEHSRLFLLHEHLPDDQLVQIICNSFRPHFSLVNDMILCCP